MKKAKTIDQLYEVVKEHETVLTSDAGLADALNRRLDRPVKGSFASTPGRLASSGDEESKKDVFLKAVEETDYSWKQISYALDKIFEAWKHTGELEKILSFERYDKELFQDIIEITKSSNTSFHSVEEKEFSGDIAVVNLYQFNELDKTTLPDEFREYNLLTDEETNLEDFNIYESGLDLVNSLIDNIESLGAENIGVVVRPESRYQSLLEAYFKSKNISYTRDENISEDDYLRTFISLLETGVTDRKLRVRDVKPLQEGLGFEYKGEDNQFLDSTDSELKEFVNILEFMEFGKALEELENITENDLSHIETLLEDLGLWNESINSENVGKLGYFIENFDSKMDEENSGVLLADPKNASVIDRPLVFLLGMSREWNESFDEEPWVDEEWIEGRNLRDFTLLCQSGDQRYFLVQDRELEEDIKPCFHLDEITGENIESFRDLPHKFRDSGSRPEESKFDLEEVEREEIDYLSQSSLSDLARSPRLYYMSRLVSEAEEEHLKKGELFHDFAELYYNHPEETNENLEEISKIFAEELEKIVDNISMIQIETEIKHGLKNLMDFLEPEEEYIGDGYVDTDSENFFAQKLGLEIDTNSTEMYFKKDGMKGKVDLIESETHLVDFKSGRKKSVKDIVKSSRPETFEDAKFPNFQALMYLAHHSKHVDGNLEFSFVYFLDGLGDILGNRESEEMATTISYVDESFDHKVYSHDLFEFLIRDVKQSNNRRKTLEKIGYTGFENFFSQMEFPEIFDKDEVLETQIYQEFEAYCIEEVGDYKYVRKGVKSMFRKIIEYRNTRYFEEDLENIQAFVEEKINEIESYEEDRYPLGDREVSELGKEDLIV
ncbi:MAG: PD-(D/E)XK nuclease family protein [Candidatus Nanohaloarchaea archaeon]